MATIGSLVVNLVANTAQFSNDMKNAQKVVKEFQSEVSGAATEAGHAFNSGLQSAGGSVNRLDAGISLLQRNMVNLTNPVGWVKFTADIIGTGLALGFAEDKAKQSAAINELNASMASMMAESYVKATLAAEKYQKQMEANARIGLLGQAGGNESRDLAFQVDTLGQSGPDLAVAEYWKRVHEFYEEHKDDIAKMSEAEKRAAEEQQVREAEAIRRLAEKLRVAEVDKEIAALEADAEHDRYKEIAAAEKKHHDDALKHQKELAEVTRNRFKDTMTEMEKYRLEMAKIDIQEEFDIIGKDVADRARATAFFSNRNAQLNANSPISFLEKGSGEEISARRAAANDPLGKLGETAQQQLAAQLDAVTATRDIADLLKNDATVTIGG